ncbi:MAG: replication/maintenance protein RepL, partial [Parachlamydiaceae bacterium]
YDGKVYSLIFINEFLRFLRSPENNFTLSEFKLLLTIYELISNANSISNCLVGVKKKYLAEQAGIDYKNLSKVFKSLQAKNILKVDDNGSIYINYQYFFMGNSMNYDLYKIQYENIDQ